MARIDPNGFVKLQDGRSVNVRVYDPQYTYNFYRCHRGHSSLTMDIDEGVTPMFMRCRQSGCEQIAESNFYPKGEPPAQMFPVRVVFRKPTKSELKNERRTNGHHFKWGGLASENVN